MNKRRQRWLAGALAAALAVADACSSSSVPASATAVATAVSQAQSTAQAAGQSAASRFAGGLTTLSAPDLSRLIGTTLGASLEITTTPPNVSNDQVTQATLNGTDRSGAWGRLDRQAREAFAGAGLQLARQAYPRAQLDLVVVDASANRLLTASYPPDGQPTYQ